MIKSTATVSKLALVMFTSWACASTGGLDGESDGESDGASEHSGANANANAGSGSDDGCDAGQTDPDAYCIDCAVRCGDGVVDQGEVCDHGESNSDTKPDACRTTCVASTCGDGIVDTGEQCDDGTANSDTTPGACRMSCTAPTCGDSIVDPAEDCDEGDAVTEDCAWDEPCTVCTAQCVHGPGIELYCGDGVLNGPELCDDGQANSNINANACRWTCTPAGCGDGVTDTDEACDDGNAIDGDGCKSTCDFVCRSDDAVASGADRVYEVGTSCYFVHKSITTWADARSICQLGNADLLVIDDAGESAFDSELGMGTHYIGYSDDAVEGTFQWIDDESIYEYWSSGQPDDAGAGEDCVVVMPETGRWEDQPCADLLPFTCERNDCGNGVVDVGEACDDGNRRLDLCAYGALACTVCDPQCQWDAGVPQVCGDGVVNAAFEGCDDANGVVDDGCAACVVDDNYACALEPSLCYNASVFSDAVVVLDDDGYNGSIDAMACLTMSIVPAVDDALNAIAVHVGVEHDDTSDLVIKLVSPSGTVVTLLNRPGFDEPDDDGVACCGVGASIVPVAVWFYDLAPVSAEMMGTAGVLPCTEDAICVYAPDSGAATPGTLDAFVGEAVGGDWQLCFGDAESGAVGSVHYATLLIRD